MGKSVRLTIDMRAQLEARLLEHAYSARVMDMVSRYRDLAEPPQLPVVAREQLNSMLELPAEEQDA